MVGRPWRTRAVVPLVAIAMWLTGCGTAFELSDKPAGQLSEWTKCPTSDWQCAELTVPVDYNEPEGPRFNIQVAMQPAESKRKRGVLIWNPGGPGLPAADQIAQFSRNLPTELLNSFDVVSFDPRGTLHSGGFWCRTHSGFSVTQAQGLMPASTVAGETLRWAGVAGPANALCSRGPSNAGSVLGTADSANDLELLRNALGVKQISFLGYSYGTRLGTTYGVRHPDRIRAMVLDSPVSADGSIVRFGAGKSVALNNGFLRVGTFCRVQTANDCGVPGGPLAAYDRAMEAQTSVEPGMSWAQIEIAAVAATQRAKDSELPNVARALAALEVGDSSPLLAVSGGQAASGSGLAPTLTSNPDTASSYDDVLVAVNCADSRDRPSGFTVSEAVRAWTGSTPRTARLGGSLAGQCLAWPAAKNPIQARSFAPAGGALIVSAVGDTLTDPKWADEIKGLIVDSQIVRWDGFGHGVSFLRDSACVDDTVTAYLVAPQQQSKVRPSTVCAATSLSTGMR